jgi:MinD superfamily P-loop ATPase
MKIAIASGKGGTGKTTVATNLACVLAKNNIKVTYIDCDVEEPNGHLFLKPNFSVKQQVFTPVPKVDESKCTGCGLCAKICEYSAIICLVKKAMVFPELCHGCGGCIKVCPENALIEDEKRIGVIESGTINEISFIHGKLDIGVAMSPPLIRQVKNQPITDGAILIDAPPGTSCPVITSVQDVDYILLVTEPTPFGLNDLGLAIDMVKELKIPFGVVVNRHEQDNTKAREYCSFKNAQIVTEIPDDRRVAVAYSYGNIASLTINEYSSLFWDLWNKIEYHTNHIKEN